MGTVFQLGAVLVSSASGSPRPCPGSGRLGGALRDPRAPASASERISSAGLPPRSPPASPPRWPAGNGDGDPWDWGGPTGTGGPGKMGMYRGTRAPIPRAPISRGVFLGSVRLFLGLVDILPVPVSVFPHPTGIFQALQEFLRDPSDFPGPQTFPSPLGGYTLGLP